MAVKRRSGDEIDAELRRLAADLGRTTEPAALLHVLQVYEEKLAIQNEALRSARAELEVARDRFIEFYDFAPNGYLTLDPDGLILRINLTGAAWLGQSGAALERLPIYEFIPPQQRRRVMDFMRRCRLHKPGRALTVDVTLRGESSREIQLLCRPVTRGTAAAREYFIAMIDITESRRLETEREAALEERAMLAGQVIAIQEEERLRIARELHDNIGQQLTALRLKLDAIDLLVQDNPEVRLQIAEAHTLGDRMDEALDFIASEMRPASLDLGFTMALEQFTLDWSRNAGIPVRLRLDSSETMRLAPATEIQLYRVTQEALHNVVKHARARTVDVTFERRGSRCLLTIADDGIGFAPGETEEDGRRGFGLIGMRERVDLIGGSIQFKARSGGGTKIVIDVPLS